MNVETTYWDGYAALSFYKSGKWYTIYFTAMKLFCFKTGIGSYCLPLNWTLV